MSVEMRLYRDGGGNALVGGSGKWDQWLPQLIQFDQAWSGKLTLELCLPSDYRSVKKLINAVSKVYQAVRPIRSGQLSLVETNSGLVVAVGSSWRQLQNDSGIDKRVLWRSHACGELLRKKWLVMGASQIDT